MTDRLATPLCEMLGIRVPLLLAPMAGGPSTPELVGAVSRAGGLGLFGVAGLTAERVRADVAAAIAIADGAPVGVNVQLPPVEPGAGRPEDVRALLAPFRGELGIGDEPPAAPAADPPPVLVEAALEAGAAVVSGALGDPAPLVPLARAAGVPLLAMATTVDEARRAEAAGADVVIAQGMEAGGHRGTFEPGPAPPLVGTMVLVPRVVDAVGVPVVAAGGIMDGRGLAAALMLGAQGVAMGTRFLLAQEARVADVHRRTVASAGETDTFVTDAVTGRPARWVRNRIATALAEGPPHLGWGAQRAAVDPVRRAAAEAGAADLLPMLAGQGAGMSDEVLPAAEIVERVVAEARERLA